MTDIRSGRWRHKPGNRCGSLVITERLGQGNGSTWVLVDCDCGSTGKRVALQNLVSGAVTDCADRDKHTDPRKVEVPKYSSLHNRIRIERGAAKDHPCAVRGCDRMGYDWSYSHADAVEHADTEGKEQGKPYSLHPDLYRPLCRVHHLAWDFLRDQLAGSGEYMVIQLAHHPESNPYPPERLCPHCGIPLASGKRSDAQYCSRLCKDRARSRRRVVT